MSVVNTHSIEPFWGPEAIFIAVEPQGALTCWSSILTILATSGPFRALLLTIRGPERFPQWMNPGVRLRVRRQHTQFWQILTRFVDYYSPFWGPEANSIVVEPQGALTCRSSTLAVWGLH